ncbi:growth-regulating factor 6-like [Magnolia sinica]|uniref:growth-regulating factor 6-like n=1 Tax=Magnolia sinica TaxID=86752 RepID=UPI00265A98BF|nr:growth-regulating factor 6-like [Magnolia sinica]
MDFGVVGLDGFVGVEGGFSPLVSEAETRQKGCGGSGFLKQGRSGLVEDDWRSLKMARTDDFGVYKTMQMQNKTPLLRSNSLFSDGQQQQLLSFSSPKQGVLVCTNDGYTYPSPTYARSAGVSSGSLNVGMHGGVLAGSRGPFTPSQWMELEHQALIYKYLTANVPIPANLLIPIRKSLNPSGFSGFSAASLRPNTLGWGSFHLGFSGNSDPEPGRCRRTDGKKWRCSRDAVADQKYCERHMNRGRHRSRKPVEGQTGHAASGTPAATTKVMPTAPSSASSGGPGGSGPSNNVAIAQQQIKSLHASADHSGTQMRMLMNKPNVNDQMQDSQSLSMLSSVNLKPRDTQFPILKQHLPFEESSRMDFGLISSDSLLNPQRSPYIESRNFIDDWPKSQSDRSAITWPDVEEIQSDGTQLSISIPVASSEFSSSTSSPTQEKLTLSPLKLSREFDPIQMGLGVGGVLTEAAQRQASWIPISWETSMGGPLGEVLNNTNNTPRDHKNSSAGLNLMMGGWDASPPLGSSPTGVLQKTTFVSLSNSSAGSSPRAEHNRAHDHTSLRDDLLGSTLVSSSIPSM